jgi:nitrate reductase molybdenum cofactor assembly chaperone NarJ/NarW
VRRQRRPDPRVVYQVASWCLDYPDARLQATLPALADALAEQPATATATRLSRLVHHLGGKPLGTLQRQYVETFDLSRRHALYLSYWTDGDTRRRGEVLARFKAAYRSSGFLVDPRHELPDYLPLVLEYAAVADPQRGADLLTEYRPSLELLRIALVEEDSPYADAVTAVCETLPGESPADRAAVMVMAGAGPPAETVGLEPYAAWPAPAPTPGAGGGR